MTRQPHDQFAKQYLAELLSPLGQVETSREVMGEVRQIDVWFAPTSQPSTNPQSLGLLSQIASSPCLLEPFRNQPSKTEIRNCILKLFSLQSQFQRKARREDDQILEANLPNLWILATSASATLLDSFGAKLDLEDWSEGVYFLAESFKTAIIAINQLPNTPATLWLRILGKGKTQAQAINQLLELPKESELRRNVLEILSSWRLTLENKQDLTEDESELIMNLSPAYLKWREDTLQEGLKAGERLVVENLLTVKFGTLDEALLRIIEPMLELPPEELARLLLELSREELLVRFDTSKN